MSSSSSSRRQQDSENQSYWEKKQQQPQPQPQPQQQPSRKIANGPLSRGNDIRFGDHDVDHAVVEEGSADKQHGRSVEEYPDRSEEIKVVVRAVSAMPFLSIKKVRQKAEQGLSEEVSFFLTDLGVHEHSALLNKVVDEMGLQLAMLAAVDSASVANRVAVDKLRVVGGTVQLSVGSSMCKSFLLTLHLVLVKDLLAAASKETSENLALGEQEKTQELPRREIPVSAESPEQKEDREEPAESPGQPPPSVGTPATPERVVPPPPLAAPVKAKAPPPAAPKAKAQPFQVGDRVLACFYGDWHPAVVQGTELGAYEGVPMIEVLWDGEFSLSYVLVTEVKLAEAALEEPGLPKPMIPPPPPGGPAAPSTGQTPPPPVRRQPEAEHAAKDKAVPPPPPLPPQRLFQPPAAQKQQVDSPPRISEPSAASEEHPTEDGNRAGDAHVGTVSSYNPFQGFGYIMCKTLPKEVWFGKQCLPDELQWREDLAASAVSFHLEPSEDGRLRAEDDSVKLLDLAADPSARGATRSRKGKQIPMASNTSPDTSGVVVGKAQKRKNAKRRLENELLDLLEAPAEGAQKEAEEKELEELEVEVEAPKTPQRRRTVLRQAVRPTPVTRKARKGRKGVSSAADADETPALGKCGAAETAEAPVVKDGPPCGLCDEQAMMCEDEDDDECLGAELGMCRKHFKELEGLERRLAKWSMQICDADANELHALSRGGSVGLRSGVFHDLAKVKLLVDYLIQRGCDAFSGEFFETPLESAITEWRVLSKKLELQKLLGHRVPKALKDDEAEEKGIRNVAKVLALLWKAGEGSVSDEHKADADILAAEALVEVPGAKEFLDQLDPSSTMAQGADGRWCVDPDDDEEGEEET
ncbi:unnamed protein product [Polarella glacialis]|uniref:Uncharacterized protein n=1 Tax=Polarella glacialis TaxID=89957 RepID=A0A813JR77_POLGL|nr:unnamed protein product [Polarella glacialis]